MKCAQTVFLVDEAVKRVFYLERFVDHGVLFMVTCSSREQLRAALEELSLPTLEAESQEGQPGDTWVSSECQSALEVGRAVDSCIDQLCQERQTAMAPGSSTVISIANLLSRGHSP